MTRSRLFCYRVQHEQSISSRTACKSPDSLSSIRADALLQWQEPDVCRKNTQKRYCSQTGPHRFYLRENLRHKIGYAHRILPLCGREQMLQFFVRIDDKPIVYFMATLFLPVGASQVFPSFTSHTVFVYACMKSSAGIHGDITSVGI